MKALVKEQKGYGHLIVKDVLEPAPGPDQVKIEVKYAGVCGSDLHAYEGHYNVKTPVILGHEFSGKVVETGKNVTECRPGDRVTTETTYDICGECRYCRSGDYNLCPRRIGLGSKQDGGWTNYVIARKESIHMLPEEVDYEAASLTEPLACAYHAMEKAEVRKGDTAVVLGPGPIGLLTAQVLQARGASVIITGLSHDKTRLAKAEELGIDEQVNIETEDVKEIVLERTSGYGADLVFECTGAPPAANMGLDLLTKKGQYVQVGIFPEEKVLLNASDIIQKEIQVTGTRSQKAADWEPSLELIRSGTVDTKALITHEFDITQWDEAYDAIKNGGGIKVSLTPVNMEERGDNT
ncbi:zinc-binding dehydrogenase [Salibacterium halotolerans]|uniref:L-iditol 2-dehydrogenase n=1 Tax=Salibacterium halotolerans TaxID=1884432 RepID=A0A1I5XL09_9BACI|nr:zinc-binding dehydrogenase [Salibacterium halotolerans]SFQ32387.1 L-iditol 2-dehydrogenase [Salibacterium halotolerans]